MKKLFDVLYACFSLFLMFAFGIAVAKAQQRQVQSLNTVYIPAIVNSGSSITGRVVNPQNIPMPGVTIGTNQGQLVVTNQNGEYAIMGLKGGTYKLTPSLGSITFSPASSSVAVPPEVTNLNFTAQIQCSQAIVNGGFEDNSGWVIPSTAYSAGYSSTEAHSGAGAMRTGIVNLADNKYSYSTTQEKVTIPAGTISAYFTFWIKPFSGDAGLSAISSEPMVGASLESVQVSGDVQYVLVLDNNSNIINTLVWQISDSRTWTQYQFNLAGYAGQTIWLHFGTFNDGLNGVSSMFVDDVSLSICPSVTPTATPTPSPTPTQCSNLLKNPSFESSTDWEILQTAYNAGYSTAQARTGSRSMRTGILSSANNIYSYSDFRQGVQIPSGAATAKARFWLYTLSSDTTSLAQTETITPTGKAFTETTLSGDLQYVLILDQNKNWIDTLVWQHTNDGYWHYYEFDLRRYAGSLIYLQFGTYNDGQGGITSMFVDDASLDTCATTPTPGPSPTPTKTPTPTPTKTPTPGLCQELIINNKFDTNDGWVIVDTAYHAGYSNTQYHSPSRSMRTGIVNLADNIFSYSDFRQAITIPSTTHHVTLSTWMYFKSSETASSLSEPVQITPTGRPFTETTLSDDLQYLLILDNNKNWIDTLVWQRSNSQAWTSMQFDLSVYTGKTIMLQWGTFNNGTGGITSMYVDDVSVQACP